MLRHFGRHGEIALGSRLRWISLALIACLLAACGGVPQIPEARQAAVIPSSSAAPVPTSAPTATAVPLPTSAPAQTPVPVAGATHPRRVALTGRVAVTDTVPVLMYHDIGNPPPGTPYRDLWVPTAAFVLEVQALKARGWTTITAAQLGRAMQTRTPVLAKTLVISLDDGRNNNYTNAFPILQQAGFVATFYIPAGLPGESSRMSYDELAVLAGAGMEIANHTMTHANLPKVGAMRLATEITGAGERLQTELAIRGVTTTVSTFAYPYGHVSPAAVRLLAEDGYTLAVTTRPGKAAIGATDPLLCPRVRVHGAETLSRFLASIGA